MSLEIETQEIKIEVDVKNEVKDNLPPCIIFDEEGNEVGYSGKRSLALVKAQYKYYLKKKGMGITRTVKEKEAQERYRKKNMGREDVKAKKREHAKTYYYKNRERLLKEKQDKRDAKKILVVKNN